MVLLCTKREWWGPNLQVSEAHIYHYGDVIMGAIASQITSLAIVYSAFYSVADQRKYQSSALLACVRKIHRGPVNSPHKWPVTWKMFPFDDVIMLMLNLNAKCMWGYSFLEKILRCANTDCFNGQCQSYISWYDFVSTHIIKIAGMLVYNNTQNPSDEYKRE